MKPFLIAVSLTVAMTALGEARPKTLAVVLRWNPNDKPSIPTFDFVESLPFVIESVADARGRTDQIGENVEEKPAVPVTTASDVAAFVREHLAKQLKAMGLDVRAAGEAQVTLRAELTDFWVSESDHYNGLVRLRLTALDASGTELWSGLASGTSARFGRSLKSDNYTEAFSNCLQDLAAKLAGSPGFQHAIAKRR
jgi:hypothetical protein